MPLVTISSISVCISKYGRTSVAPPSMKINPQINISMMPFVAARLTPFVSFAPSARETTAFKPTPRPTDTAIIRF